jgi:hypothetical protein
MRIVFLTLLTVVMVLAICIVSSSLTNRLANIDHVTQSTAEKSRLKGKIKRNIDVEMN